MQMAMAVNMALMSLTKAGMYIVLLLSLLVCVVYYCIIHSYLSTRCFTIILYFCTIVCIIYTNMYCTLIHKITHTYIYRYILHRAPPRAHVRQDHSLPI